MMGKATRLKQQSAREKIAAQRAAEKRAERRRTVLLTGGSTIAVIAVVLVLVLVKILGGSSGSGGPVTGAALPASVAAEVTHVPPSTLASVGGGTIPAFTAANHIPPFHPGLGPPLTSNGHPEMLYIGAEFCPYCAATRWSMAIALSRFGTLSPLRGIRSSSTDTDPSTATLTFYKSTYKSNYLAFTPVEAETVTKTPLQKPTAAQQAVWNRYEPNPAQQGFPFIAFGNKWAIEGPLFDPAILGGAGKTWTQIAAALHDPKSAIAQAVDGEANEITAAICSMTGDNPASVCSASTIKTLQGSL
jgi:hypothetical protein